MALQIIASLATGQSRFTVEAYKKAQHIGEVTGLHRIASQHLAGYLEDMAEAELERNAAPEIQPAPSTELVPFQRQPQNGPRPRTTPAQFAQAALRLAHWDLTEYLWSLENLKNDVSPAAHRSFYLAAACIVVKALQLHLWPSSSSSSPPPHHHPDLSPASLLTYLTAYHSAFAVFYLSALHVIGRCRRLTEEMRAKCRNKHVSEDDVRAWGGFVPSATNWLARSRHFRRCLCKPTLSWEWIIDPLFWVVQP